MKRDRSLRGSDSGHRQALVPERIAARVGRTQKPRRGDALQGVSMTGDDLIEALKRRGEWGSYFTYEGYEFVKGLKSAREICIALRAWGAADVRETDAAAVLVQKLHEALSGGGRSPLSGNTGTPEFYV